MKALLTRFFLLFLAVYFMYAAAMQYNDPDPLHWMALYGLTAFACGLALAGRHLPWLLWLLCGMALSEILITGDGFWYWLRHGSENLITTRMSAEKPWIELGREFLGALINLAAVGWLLVRARKSAGHASES